MAQHLPCAATTRVSTDEFWGQKHVCPQERWGASAEETTVAWEGRVRSPGGGGGRQWRGHRAVPPGPQSKGRPPGRSIPGHQGGDQWVVTRGRREREWPVEDHGPWGSPRNAPWAMRVSLGTPPPPPLPVREQPTASPLSPRAQWAAKPGGAGRVCQTRGSVQGAESPTMTPRDWFKAMSQSEASR